MKLTFFGATREVTGSMHLLEINGSRILLDCGLYQGHRADTYERNLKFPFDPASIDTLILSHAHIDHSGNIPNVVKQGFSGPIWATSATRSLCTAMLRDSGHIQEDDVEYLNKKRKRKGLPPVEPLYTIEDAVRSLESFIGVPYHRAITVAPGVKLTFVNAGHILGAAHVVLDLEEKGRKLRLVFSGDVGRPHQPIIRPPEPPQGADVLISESTYGDRLHEPPDDATKKLRQVILDTYHHGGKVIIPSFAVGRTQEIVYELHELMETRKIPQIPIFVDSPLAVDVTEIFRLHPECYNHEVRRFLEATDERDPFGFSRMTYIRSVEKSKELNFLKESAVIISASGMCETGRILHHLKNNIGNPNNTVLFVGFQAEGTLGRRILDGAKEARIFGEMYKVRANVESINGYSAHADKNELLAWLDAVGPKRLQQMFVVHGEKEAAESFAGSARQVGVRDVQIPVRGQSFEL